MTIEAQIDLSKDAQAEFEERLGKYETEKEEAAANIEKFETEIAQKQEELAGCNEDPTPKHTAATAQRELITKKMIVEVNDILTKASPSALVLGLEALVGIMRNVNTANNIDVELFFSEPIKLLAKFKRMESHGLTYAHVLKHKAELDEHVKAFE